MTDPTPESGRELDAVVAEEIFGRVVVIAPVGDGLTRTYEVWGETMEEASAKLREAYSNHKGLRDPYFYGPNYSTLIGAAWEVVEEIHATDENANLTLTRSIYGHWSASFVFGGRDEAQAETAPLAICRAALKLKQAVRADTEGADARD